MSKIVEYVCDIPGQINNYGLGITAKKLVIDTLTFLGLETLIPDRLRWDIAHDFHAAWKIYQKNRYGAEEYNRRIDQKSIEVLEDFYETGTDFTGKTVLDVGCGTRGILPVIKAACRIGLDPTIKKVQSHFTFDPTITYLSDKAEHIPLLDNTVDIVTCNNALNHFQDPKAALHEIYRVLKPGGKLLLEVFIERRNIAHTVEYTPETLEKLVCGLFTPNHTKYEQLKVRVVIDEKIGGRLPMRWGGVFTKEAPQ